ncbi:dihydrolipoyl dehydrogenase [Neobacillus sp. Marseille-QA0830]
MEFHYDVIILGGGTGGYVAAIRASQLGLRVAIIEKEKLGGTCLHRGCIPSKSLLRSAEIYAQTKDLEEYGILADHISFDFQKIQERKKLIVEQLYRGVQYLMQKGKIDVLQGIGKIVHSNPQTDTAIVMNVYSNNGEVREVTAKHVIIATGASPRSLPGLEADGEGILYSDHALELETLPSSVVIVGGGVIGIEWASLFADFGVHVTVVEAMDRILPLEDKEISKEAQRLLRKKGIKFFTNAKLQPDPVVDGNLVEMVIEFNGNQKLLSAEKVLLSIGRKANTDQIGLENTVITIKNGFIETNDFYQTSDPRIYAIGDVIGGLQLAHVASHEGILAVEHLTGKEPHPLDYSSVPKCIYSHPQISSVGLTEDEALAKGFSIKVGKFPFKAIGKALVQGDTDGFAKVLFDRDSNRLLGVHMVGPNVTELISEAGLAKFLQATQLELAYTIHPHPTLSEVFGETVLASEGVPIHI